MTIVATRNFKQFKLNYPKTYTCTLLVISVVSLWIQWSQLLTKKIQFTWRSVGRQHGCKLYGRETALFEQPTVLLLRLQFIIEQVQPNCGKECAECCHIHCVRLHTPSTGSVIRFTASCPNVITNGSFDKTVSIAGSLRAALLLNSLLLLLKC
jgi:hypothetical protein